ncbi:hypothetical protein [Mycolicibacterium doricum]|nr:hypothetical protein [Mycolicibacterium doricum]MCV7268297.1 SRPBCC family protein [Mycolicibacterium doricum]ORV37387.1 hypothetical protein AWC01_16225 [Mycolicibacterium doricum]
MRSDVVKVGAVAALLYAARRYFRDWGTTKAESASHLPGDGLVHPPVLQATEAVSIEAPAESTWPWLVQMGQDRGGLYSYERLENTLGLRYRNADQVHDEWQHLAVGDPVRLAPKGWLWLEDGIEMRVAELVEGKTVVLFAEPPGVPWTMVWSFHLMPRGVDRCRLLIRSRLGLRHPGEVMLAELFGPARAMLTRGMLLGIKRRAESHRQAGAAAAPASAEVHRVG